MSALLFVHALASPGVLIGANGLVQFAGAGNLPAGAAVLIASNELEGGALPQDTTVWLYQENGGVEPANPESTSTS